MLEVKRYFKNTVYIIFIALLGYLPLALRADSQIKDFSILRFYLIMIVIMLPFAVLLFFIERNKDKRVQRAKEAGESWRSIAKLKTIYGVFFTLWILAIGFIYIIVTKYLDLGGLPDDSTLLMAGVCILLIATVMIAIYQFIDVQRKQR